MIKYILVGLMALTISYFVYTETGVTTAIVIFLLIMNTIRNLDFLKVHSVVMTELSKSISELTKNKG